MNFRTNALTRVGATALLAVGAVAAAAAPAYADPAEADLSVKSASSKIAVDAPGKDFRIDIHNAGPGVATDTEVTVDWSKLDPELVKIDPAQFEGCDITGETAVCAIGDGAAGETLPLPLTIDRVPGATVGPAGSFTVSVRSAAPDPNEANNSDTVEVEVVDSGVDLTAVAFDVYAISQQGEPSPVVPGHTAPLFWFLANQGDRAAKGISYSITLPEHVTFVDNFEGCAPSAGKRTLVCQYPDAVLEPGDALFDETGTTVKVSEDAPGPVVLKGGLLKGSAMGAVDVSTLRAKAASVAPNGLQVASAAELRKEIDPGDNDASFSVFVAAKGGAGGGAGPTLPVTGVHAGLIGGVGLLVVVAGTAMFLVARRRRVVLVAPNHEASPTV